MLKIFILLFFIYFLLLFTNSEIASDSRIDCAPRSEDSNRQICELNKCIWDDYYEKVLIKLLIYFFLILF